MIKYSYILILFLSSLLLQAQSTPERNVSFPLLKTIDMADIPEGEGPLLLNIKAMPHPANGMEIAKQEIMLVKQKKYHQQNSSYKTTSTIPMLQYIGGYSGNLASGTPNDNSIAVSNGGKVISVANTNMRIYNDTNPKQLSLKNLAVMANSLGTLNRSYDPKVMYDPNTDRFILVFLNGTTSMDNNIIVGFSQTNDPVGKWNFYKLPGTREGDSSWSDYPIISIGKEDLYITVNKLQNNMGWKDGFIKSVIWQVRMKEGFAGDSLVSNYFGNNVYGGKSLWSICPVQGGIEPTHPYQYFLTVRPADRMNDSVFLYKIDNTVSSGNANISVKYIKSDRMYGLPPSAIQPPGNQVLETNDCRVLTGIYENGVIQYCQTSIDTNTYNSCIFHGVISDPDGNASIKSRLIASDTLDFAYPCIAYCGEGATDHGAMVTFSFVNDRVYPGTMAVYIDRDLKDVSDFLICKKGEGAINVLIDTAERWGDYTGIQRKYNEKGVCFLNGSWGDNTGATRTWIAKVRSTDLKLSITNTSQTAFERLALYPNPTSELLYIDFDIATPENLVFDWYSMDGKYIQSIYKDIAKPGTNRFSFNTNTLAKGLYILKITGDRGTIISHKVLVD